MRKLYFIIMACAGLICTSSIAQNVPGLKKQWGEFGDKPGQFRFPAMIADDNEKYLYVVDQHNHRIQKFDSEGNYILMWGRKGNGDGEFYYPYGITLDSKGDVYVSDMQNNRIQKFSGDGKFIASAGIYGEDEGQFKYPYGIAADENDIIYVIDAFNYRIQKFSSGLKFISYWGNQESIGFRFYMPHEIVIGKQGEVIISDRQNHRISVFTKDGGLMKRFCGYGEGDTEGIDRLSEPHGITVNDDGDILVCDRYNYRIHKFTHDGRNIIQWPAAGTHTDSKQFPIGITVIKNQTYITDHYAHCIQMY